MPPPKRQIVVSRSALQASRIKHLDGAFTGKEEPAKMPKFPGLPEKLKATFFPDEPAPPPQPQKVVIPEQVDMRQTAKIIAGGGCSAAGLLFLVGVLVCLFVHMAAGGVMIVVSFFISDSALACSACHEKVKNRKATRCSHCTSFFIK